jgi:hypothetical protein
MPDRGGRNPAPLAANGRMFIQGDRVLYSVWMPTMARCCGLFSRLKCAAQTFPRDGSNMVATDDTLFVTIGSECIALDAQTGERGGLPVHAAKGRDWGWLSASKGQLLSTTVKSGSSYKADSGEWYDGVGAVDIQRVVSDALLSHNPTTGKEQWSYQRWRGDEFHAHYRG